MRHPGPEQIAECLSALREYPSLEGEAASAALARAAAAVKVSQRPVVRSMPIAWTAAPKVRFIPLARAAKILGISLGTFWRWKRDGIHQIRHVTIPGGPTQVDAVDVARVARCPLFEARRRRSAGFVMPACECSKEAAQ
jgi:hypothetical protein